MSESKLNSEFKILDFAANLAIYERFGHVENYGDGSQTDFCHPLFQMVTHDLKEKLNLELEISSARLIYTLDDKPALDWHFDARNSDDTETSYTLLLYFNSMSTSNGGLLQFESETIVPSRGMGVLIDNTHPKSIHRATPMVQPLPRKLIKVTYRKLG